MQQQGIFLKTEPAAADYLAEIGYDPKFGARPLKRAIQKELETPLAREILAGKVQEGSKILVKKGDKGLVFVPQ